MSKSRTTNGRVWHTDGGESNHARDAPAGLPTGAWHKSVVAVRGNAYRPTRIAVMGQTAVGKSSLINALFNADLRTGAVRPTTTEPAEVRTELGQGRSLTFVDLPGIGEGRTSDACYLDMYRQEVERSDIVHWLFSAESRSLLTALNGLAALHAYGAGASLHDGTTARFVLPDDQRQLLEAKSSFVREAVQEAVRADLGQPIVTSSRFRYRLVELLADVVRRADEATVARLGSALDLDSLAALPLGAALEMRNFWSLDTTTRRTVDIAHLVNEAT